MYYVLRQRTFLQLRKVMPNDTVVKSRKSEIVCPRAQYRFKCTTGVEARCRDCSMDVFVSTSGGRLVEYDLEQYKKGRLVKHTHRNLPQPKKTEKVDPKTSSDLFLNFRRVLPR